MDETTKEAWLKGKDLSPEALEKRRKINKKILLFGCLPVLLFGLVAVFFAVIEKEATSPSSQTAVSEKWTDISSVSGDESTSSSPQTVTSEDHADIPCIPGLSPTDVYVNLEKEGFKTESTFDSENGNLWSSTRSANEIKYKVDMFSYSTKNVVSISATAMIDVNEKDIVATKQFFQFISTLPYDNANPKLAASWVDKNFNNNKATTTIGGVTFTMLAPTQFVRMLLIEVSQE